MLFGGQLCSYPSFTKYFWIQHVPIESMIRADDSEKDILYWTSTILRIEHHRLIKIICNSLGAIEENLQQRLNDKYEELDSH